MKKKNHTIIHIVSLYNPYAVIIMTVMLSYELIRGIPHRTVLLLITSLIIILYEPSNIETIYSNTVLGGFPKMFSFEIVTVIIIIAYGQYTEIMCGIVCCFSFFLK